MEERFIMIKNEVVRPMELNKESLVKSMNNTKVTNIIAILDQCVNRMNKCSFSIEELCDWCGVVAKTGKGKTVEQIRMILIALQSEGYISELNVDLLKVKMNEHISCTYNGVKDEDKMFFKLPIDTFSKLVALKNTDCTTLYMYIKSMIGENNYCCFPTVEDIISDTGLTKTSVEKCTKILNEEKLLFVGNIGQVIVTNKDGSKSTQTASNVYVIDDKDMESALEKSKQYYINERGAILTNKKISKKTRQINALNTNIKIAEKKGKDTTSLQNKLNILNEELEEAKDKVSDLSRTEALEQIDKLIEESGLNITAGDIATLEGVSVFDAKGCNEILKAINTNGVDYYYNEINENKEDEEIEDDVEDTDEEEINDTKYDKLFKTKTVVIKSNVNKDRWGSRSPFNDGYNPFKSQDEFLKSINKDYDDDDFIDSLL